jgi:imidazolonepropionase-like amidohydrolase
MVLAVRAGHGFDGEEALPEGVVVLVDEGRILAVGGAGLAVPADVPVLDFPAATVLPGLVNCHVHLCADSRPGALDRLVEYGPAELTAVIERGLRQQLAAGVTTVRDLGDCDGAVLAWRDHWHHGARPPPPTVVASGPPITSRQGHCANMGGEAAGVDELRAGVLDRAARGADVVKVMASGGVMTPGTDVLACQFTLPELRIVVQQAHSVGLPVTAHAHGLPAVQQVVEADVDGVEHCTCLTPAGIDVPDALLESLAALGAAVCPTLGRDMAVALPPELLAIMERIGLTRESRLAAVGRMHRAGVRLVSGGDDGIDAGKPHGSLPGAIADLVASGVSPGDALASATSLAANACGLGGCKGRLRNGYDADLLIVAGDPLADIRALREVSAVMLRGERVDVPA